MAADYVASWRIPSRRRHRKTEGAVIWVAIGMLFDWLVTGHVIETNPAHSVRGPRYTAKKGRTPVLTPEEADALIESIPITKKNRPTIQRRPISLIFLGYATAR